MKVIVSSPLACSITGCHLRWSVHVLTGVAEFQVESYSTEQRHRESKQAFGPVRPWSSRVAYNSAAHSCGAEIRGNRGFVYARTRHQAALMPRGGFDVQLSGITPCAHTEAAITYFRSRFGPERCSSHITPHPLFPPPPARGGFHLVCAARHCQPCLS